jgi:hypothetical protein
MARYKVKYPSGVELEKYKTTHIGALVETKGKVFQRPNKSRFYFSKVPAKGFAMRKSGVARKSEDVRAINAQLEAIRHTDSAPAVICAGKPWDEFVKCLKSEMSDLIKPVAAEGGTKSSLEWLKL